MLRKQGGGVEYNENNFKEKKKQLRNNLNQSIKINQENKPWSKLTSTIRIL